jgi:PTS system beta-glucosides-specific IIC component
LPSGNAYAYSIFPIIVGAWLAAKIEPWLKSWIPAVVRSIFAPLLEIFIVSTLLLVVFGPIIMLISGSIASAINWVLALSYPIAGAVIGGLYQVLVIFGLHWAVIPIIAAQIADPGYSPLNAIVSVTMIAQGGGALALWIKAKNPRIKQLAGPATISAFCGVTEPAMYGLNLKYGRVFVTASIGGAVGGLITGLLNVNMWGFTGAFVGFPSFVNPAGIDGSFTGFWIASFVTLITSFALTYFFGFKESDFDTERVVKKVRLGRREPVAK